MQTGAITNYIDVAQLVLYAFWIFFALLVIYLTLESKREGFPLITTRPGERLVGILPMPRAKVFKLHDGSSRSVPVVEQPEAMNARQISNFEGAPFEPLGNPMQDGIGPASYTQRMATPELTMEGEYRTVPLRIATDHWISAEDPDPRGMDVITLDGLVAGVCRDLWVDRASTQLRYLEVAVPGGLRGIVLPMELVRVASGARGVGRVKIASVTAAQLAAAPVPVSPDCITSREEDRIQAYFASGHLYAIPSRQGPLL